MFAQQMFSLDGVRRRKTCTLVRIGREDPAPVSTARLSLAASTWFVRV